MFNEGAKMLKGLIFLGLCFNAFAGTNDFTLVLKDYESFGGATPVVLEDARAQIIAESFSATEKKCFKRSGLFNSKTEPFMAKINLNVKRDGNKMELSEARSLWQVARVVLNKKVPSFCDVNLRIVLVSVAKTEAESRILLSGEILKEANDFYFQSGMYYNFLGNPEVGMIKMPNMLPEAELKLWESLDPSNTKIQTNY